MRGSESEIDRFTRASNDLAVRHRSGKLVCLACAHRCKLADGARGICRVRFREGNELRVPWGYTAGFAVDPIEKKPFFHVCPGSDALSFGMLGCDMRCEYCQNWLTSQALRDAKALTSVRPASAEELAATGVRTGCTALVSTYNEPLISSEWAREVFARAQGEGLWTGFVSNGHGTRDVLEYLRPTMELMKIDLKSFRQSTYRDLGGSLDGVLNTIRWARDLGLWLEVVTLVVPGFNDELEELADIASFLAEVSVDIPWHVTAFHPDYRMTDPPPTPLRTLLNARDVGRRAGLRHVYLGNVAGRVEGAEDTVCPKCGRTLVVRRGFRVLDSILDEAGTCPSCGYQVPGRWGRLV